MRWFAAALGFFQLQQDLNIVKQVPLIVLSSLFMGLFAALAFRALKRLDKIGARLSLYGLIFSLSREYLLNAEGDIGLHGLCMVCGCA